jgi:hypothetical protein
MDSCRSLQAFHCGEAFVGPLVFLFDVDKRRVKTVLSLCSAALGNDSALWLRRRRSCGDTAWAGRFSRRA